VLVLPTLEAQTSQFINPMSSQSLGDYNNPAGAGPPQLKGVGIDQLLDNQVDLDLEFVDADGRQVRLGDAMGGRPTVLALVYYECPMLCTLELNGLLKAMRVLKMTAGDDYQVVTVSFDPREGPELAKKKKDQYINQYVRAGVYDRRKIDDGWRFLTGDEDSIKALADSVGFHYRFDEASGLYRHASGIVTLTPTGKVSRYQMGVEYSARDLKFALIEASASKIGSPVDAVVLYCFHYDPLTGKYGFVIMRALRLMGAATLLLMGGFVGLSLWRERRKARAIGHGAAS